MLKSPFIVKVAYYMPDSINQDKNASHIDYIAHRPGADLGDPEVGDPDYIVDDDSSLDSASVHIKYIDERPGSHGLFGDDEIIPNFKNVQNEIKNHEGIVWRMVVSLHEDDAKTYSFIERKSWEEAMRRTLPELSEAMGIREDNLKWVAAYHPKEGHPHVHLVVWENTPERTRGMINIPDVKKTFFREMFTFERDRLNTEKTIAREEIRKIAKEDIQKTMEILKDLNIYKLENTADKGEQPGIVPELKRKELEELGQRLHELKEIMPKEGKMVFKFMPEEAKTKALEITDWLLKQPGFEKQLKDYFKAVDDMSRFYVKDGSGDALFNAHEDIRKRVAQFVIRGAGELNRTNIFEFIPHNAGYAKNVLVNSFSAPANEEAIKNTTRSFARILIATGTEKEEAVKLITAWKERVGVGLEQKDIDKYVDNALKVKSENLGWGREMIVSKKEWNELFKAVGQEPPAWAWKVTPESRLQMTNTVWKAAWRAVAKEKIKAEAQAELEKRKDYEKTRQQARARELGYRGL